MDLQSILSYSLLVPSLIEAVKQAVLLFEVPGKSGAEKSSDVIAYVQAELPKLLPGNATAEEISTVLATVQPLINLYVSIFNKPGGIFSKAPTAPAVQPPAPAPVVDPEAEKKAEIEKLKNQIAALQEQQKTAQGDELAAIQGKIARKTARLSALQQ